jgi:hypothetical protein
MGLLYTRQVRLNWNFLRLAMLAFLTVWGAGCSGINASGTVSPATFFLPGVKAAPSPAVTPAPMAVSTPFQQLPQAG